MRDHHARGRRAVAASVASFVGVALVAAVPGSPFTPVLPETGAPSGPFRLLAEGIGLDAINGSALVALGVCAIVAAAAAFLFALRQSWSGRLYPRTVLWLAVGLHVALLLLPLLFSRDVYSYSFYGKIAATYHANPYVSTPADFPGDSLASLVGPKWFDTPAVYGPLWTQVSGLVVRAIDDVAGQIQAFRAIAIASSIATVVLVGRVARDRWPGREAFAMAAIGLNPLVLFQSAASGHNDLLVALSVAVALAFATGRRELPATAALAIGTMVKATAAVPLALYVVSRIASHPPRERRSAAVRHVGLAAAIGVLGALPFLNATDPTLGMAELAGHEGWLAPSRFFRRLFDAVSADTLGAIPRIAFGGAVLVSLFVLGRELIRRAPNRPLLDGASWGWGLILLMLLGPVLLPWYVTWALPVAFLLPRVPRLVLLGTGVLLTLSQWTSEPSRFGAAYDANVLVGHYVLTPAVIALLAWLLLDLRRVIRERAPLEDRPEPVAAPEREG